MNRLSRIGMLLGLTAITALCMAPPVRAGTSPAPGQSSASRKPLHGGGSGVGLPYATASTVSQLIADINYANSVGGAITINLAPGATFDLKSADNTTEGGNGLPVIGATKAVDLTLIGNGATLNRIAVVDRYSTVKNPFRLFDVASGASLTLDHVTLQGGGSGGGGAIFNHGTLNVINGTTLAGNSGGAVFNAGGATYATYNDGGTVTVSNSTLSGNAAAVNFGRGGGLFNNGTATVENASSITGNTASDLGADVSNLSVLYLDSTSAIGILDGNSAISF